MSERRLPEAADTERLGAALARGLRALGPGALVVYLEGELGSGKTTLARGLLRELGVAGTVRSPSYTLLECYECADRRVLHVDLYRLNDAAEVAPLGLRDELSSSALLLIEWPERAAEALPSPDLRVGLDIVEGGRLAQLRAETPAGHAWLEAISEPRNSESKRV